VAWFFIFSIKPTPPRVSLDRAVPGPQTRFIPLQQYHTYTFTSSPAHCLSKTSPGGSVFDLYPKTHPLTSCLIARSQALNPGLLDLNTTLPTCFQALLHVVCEKRARAARFSIYTLKLRPLTSCLIARSQALNSCLTDLNNTVPTRFQAPPHVVRENRAWAARFLGYPLKSTPPHELLNPAIPGP
jgi:hypothetical protein